MCSVRCGVQSSWPNFSFSKKTETTTSSIYAPLTAMAPPPLGVSAGRALGRALSQSRRGWPLQAREGMRVRAECRASLSTGRDPQMQQPGQPPRFYAEGRLPLEEGSVVRLEADESKHATRVLRLKDGDVVELCDGVGGVVQARNLRQPRRAP